MRKCIEVRDKLKENIDIYKDKLAQNKIRRRKKEESKSGSRMVARPVRVVAKVAARPVARPVRVVAKVAE